MVLVPMEKTLEQQMKQFVAKANELITQYRSKMSLMETRLLLYVISKVKPTDIPDTEYLVSVSEFSKICGLKGYPEYTRIRQMVMQMNKSFWVENLYAENEDTLLVWFSRVRYHKSQGTIKFKFNEDVQPFLFALKKRYTSYPLHYILPMRSQYSVKLYELLKCYKDRDPDRDYFSFYLEDLKKVLGAENYKQWIHFRQKALEPAVGILNSDAFSGEINFYSDLKVSYRVEKQGRSVHGVIFHVERKTTEELAIIASENKSILLNDIIRPKNYEDINLPGQMSMDGMVE